MLKVMNPTEMQQETIQQRKNQNKAYQEASLQ